jgi:hypothetical protein
MRVQQLRNLEDVLANLGVHYCLCYLTSVLTHLTDIKGKRQGAGNKSVRNECTRTVIKLVILEPPNCTWT